MFLKEIGSDKKVFGFDSFSGFPPIYNSKDDISEYERMANEGIIDENHINDVRKNMRWKQELSSDLLVKNISSSGAFSDTSLELVNRKIKQNGLDNIILVDGAFSETMNDDVGIDKIMAVIIDCDLYQSYIETLEFIWPLLEEGGFIHLDEYYSLKFPGARIATDEFLKDKKASLKVSERNKREIERWYAIKG